MIVDLDQRVFSSFSVVKNSQDKAKITVELSS